MASLTSRVRTVVYDGQGFVPLNLVVTFYPADDSCSSTITVYGITSSGTEEALVTGKSLVPSGASSYSDESLTCVIELPHNPIVATRYVINNSEDIKYLPGITMNFEMPAELTGNSA